MDKSEFLDEKQAAKLKGERSVTRYVRIDSVLNYLWKLNPKLHDIGTTWNSIEQYGFRDKAAFDTNLENAGGGKGAFVYGNGRIEALHWAWKQGNKPPRGVLHDEQYWYIPVEFGLDAPSREAAQAFGIDHNVTTLSGGDLAADSIMKLFNEPLLAKIWQENTESDVALVSMDNHDLAGLLEYLNPPEFDAGNAVGDDDTNGTPNPPIPINTVRQVMLFFSHEDLEAFNAKALQLRKIYDENHLEQVIMKAMDSALEWLSND